MVFPVDFKHEARLRNIVVNQKRIFKSMLTDIVIIYWCIKANDLRLNGLKGFFHPLTDAVGVEIVQSLSMIAFFHLLQFSHRTVNFVDFEF